MNWPMFVRHLSECEVVLYCSSIKPDQIVIRCADGDHELAACHRSRDGKTLVLDLGSKL